MSNLRIPGPTPLPPEVLQAQSKPMVDHRGPEFQTLLQRVTANLKTLFQTKNDVLVLTSSGTGGMESAVVNTVNAGDKIICVDIGNFGERFVQLLKTYGANVVVITVEWGKAVDPDAVRQSFKANPDAKALFITHNETSTGVTNPIGDISKVVKGEFGKLLVVDAISGLGSIPFPVDEWKVDVAIAGSQKGWMSAPGLSMVSINADGWKAVAQAKTPRFYFDYARAKDIAARGQTPWTPAVSTIFGMDVGLQMLLKDGLNNIFARHAAWGKFTREGVKAMGLKLFADEKVASNTVTAVWCPESIDVNKFRQLLRDEHDIVVARGQGKLETKIFRVAHMGLCSIDELKSVMSAMKVVLSKLGFTGAK